VLAINGRGRRSGVRGGKEKNFRLKEQNNILTKNGLGKRISIEEEPKKKSLGIGGKRTWGWKRWNSVCDVTTERGIRGCASAEEGPMNHLKGIVWVDQQKKWRADL